MKHFLNLTNGIELLRSWDGDGATFIRIQSTTCEQKDWDRLILDLDNNLLLQLAIGNECHVWDYSNHTRPARAIRQGLEFVRFSVERVWFGRDYVAPAGQSTYFRTVVLSPKAENKLRYFRRFVMTDDVILVGHSQQTVHDGDYQWYVEVLRTHRDGEVR